MKVVKKHQRKYLDTATFITGVLLPILTIPQAYTIWVTRQTEGVSLFTWSFYLLASLLFAIFGLIHKEKLLIITYVPFVIIELIIVVGLLVHG